MIYLAGRDVREIYLGNKPVASVYLGARPIWQSRVYADTGAAVIVLPSDAVLRIADGVTYTVEAVGGGVSCAAAEAVPGADAGNAAVFAIPVLAQPYMRHIAPTQSASPYAPLAETMLVILPSERGGVSSVGGPEQVTAVTPGQGNDADARHIGSPIQRSDMVAGEGGILADADCGISLQRVNITGGAGAVTRQTEVSGGVYGADVIGGAGDTMVQSHIGGGAYRANPIPAAGNLHGGYGVAAAGCGADGNLADGRLYAAWATGGGAVPEANPMYGDTDDIAACAPASSLRAEIAPGSAGIIPVSCYHQTPTAVAEMLGGYAAIRQTKSSVGAPSACVAAVPVGAAGAPGTALPTIGAICAACMITRIYTDPSSTVFDTSLVTEMDILALAEIDQMAIQN